MERKLVLVFLVFLIFSVIGAVSAENINYEDTDYYINSVDNSYHFDDIKNNSNLHLKEGLSLNNTLKSEYYINNTYNNEDIQDIINNISSGSTIIFLGANYTNIHLDINKPLNIIGELATINSNLDQTVFSISNGGSGTNISGFKIISKGNCISGFNITQINIRNNKLYSENNAINFEYGRNIIFSNNSIYAGKKGISLVHSNDIKVNKNSIKSYNSNYGVGIYLLETWIGNGINITNNNINNLDKGIFIDRGVYNILIKNNNISNCEIGIYIPNSANQISILNNKLSSNREGVSFSGDSNKFVFKSNSITDSVVGFSFEDYNIKSLKGLTVESNYFVGSSKVDIESATVKGIKLGSNFVQRSCPNVNVKSYDPSIINDGTNYALSFGDNNLPNFDITLRYGDGTFEKIKVTNGEANIPTNRNPTSMKIGSNEYSGKLTEMLEEYINNKIIDNSIDREKEKKEDPINNKKADNSNYEKVNNTINTDVSKLSTGHNSTSSLGAYSSSDTGESGSSNSASNSLVAKSLSYDEESFRVQSIGLLILIILIVVFYYYRDFRKMLKK